MADTNVFISGAAEGALAQALNGLPPWATQKTAEDIQLVLQKILKVETDALAQAIKCCNGAGQGGVSKADLEKVNDEVEKLAKNLKRVNEEDAKRKKREAQEDKEWKDKDSRDRKERASSLAWQKLLGALVVTGKEIQAVQKQYFITSNDLFKSGVNLLAGQNNTTSSMMSLNQIVTLTGLRLQTFQKVVEKYSSSINAVGVVKFAKTISLTNSRLQALGYSSEEQAELIGTLIESESSYSDIRFRSAKQLADDAAQLGKQLTRMSLLTGQSNEKLQENLRAMSKSSSNLYVMAEFGKEAADRLNFLASSAKDADIGSMFQEIGSAAIPQISKTYQALAQAGAAQQAQELSDIVTRVREGGLSAEEGLRQSAQVVRSLSSSQIKNLKIQEEAGNEGAATANKAFYKLLGIGNTLSTATTDQVDSAITAQSSLSRFSTALEATRSLTERAFPLLETQVNLAAAGLEKFNQAMITSMDVFKAETRSWIAVGLEILSLLAAWGLSLRAIKGSFSILGDAVKALGTGATRVGGMLSTFGGWVMKAGGFLLRLIAPVAKLVAAFEVGYAIGSILYATLSKFEWFNDAADAVFGVYDKVVDLTSEFFGTVAEKASQVGAWFSDIGKTIADTVSSWATSVVGWFNTGIAKIGNKILELFPWINDIGKAVKSVTDVLKDAYKLFMGQFDYIGNVFSGVKDKAKSWFSWIPGVGDEEPKKVAEIQKTEAVKAAATARATPVNVKPKVEISVPKAPAQTTIASPSAVPPAPAKPDATPKVDTAGNTVPTPPNIPTRPETSSINSTLDYQTTLLIQLLESSQALVSVNKDILKYTKVHS